MNLKNPTVGELIAGAGGDPWAVNLLQAGSPAQIDRLAQAFSAAGRHNAEAEHTFEQAQQMFNAAWNHQDGTSPINASAEVQRLTKSLGALSDKLRKIGADLEAIATSLAEELKAGASEIAFLEAQIRALDDSIELAIQDAHNHPDAETRE